VNEIHSLDPEKIAREQVQQAAISIAVFLLVCRACSLLLGGVSPLHNLMEVK